jgi:NAD+ kinase
VAVVALVVHEERAQAAELARTAASWLEERGHEVRLPKPDADIVGLSARGVGAEELATGLDLAVTMGGDGTILRAVQLVGRQGVPLLGVNLGRLGYLADLEPDGLTDGLERFLGGHYQLEDRMMLSATTERAGQSVDPDVWALNEVVVEKPVGGHTVHVAVWVGGRFWTTYAADGLIVATPTGSTAYAFSARGPIMSPLMRALLMTPVSPHMPFDRSLLVDASDDVRIQVTDRPVLVVVDGREAGLLERGDAIVCSAAPKPARFVTFGPRDFYGILKTKFGVADR